MCDVSLTQCKAERRVAISTSADGEIWDAALAWSRAVPRAARPSTTASRVLAASAGALSSAAPAVQRSLVSGQSRVR